MKIAIIDPGYEHGNGHHETVNLGLARSIGKNGGRVQVLAAENLCGSSLVQCLRSGLEVAPIFKTPCYPANQVRLTQDEHRGLVRSFRHELRQAFQGGLITPGTYIMMHTGYAFHLQGLAEALWHIGEGQLGGIFLLQMFAPGAWTPVGSSSKPLIYEPVNYLRYSLALKLLAKVVDKHGLQTRLMTSCRAYQRTYAALWQRDEVLVHPAIVNLEPLEIESRKTEKARILFYIGSMKEEKGFRFAAKLALACAEKLKDITAVFHFNDDFPGAGAYSGLLYRLEESSALTGRLELHRGHLSAAEYSRLVCSVHGLCILYEPAAYAAKTSGIFWDGLRQEKLDWIITEGTWPAKELEELGIDYLPVEYGNVESALQGLENFLSSSTGAYSHGIPEETLDLGYRDLLNSDLGDFLHHQAEAMGSRVHNARYARKPKDKILVIRTDYDHFSGYAGPGGFIPCLREWGYRVDEWLIPPGRQLYDQQPRIQAREDSNPQDYISYYQPNSEIFEARLMEGSAEGYDVIHFLDAEHCGVLMALEKLRQGAGWPRHTRLVATFHQPVSILNEIIKQPAYLEGFDRIHMLSPCQLSYFDNKMPGGKARVRLVPHGVAPELFLEKLPDSNPSEHALLPELSALDPHTKLVITVGNWLRDFGKLLETAVTLQGHDDILFVVVSKGLELSDWPKANTILLNRGISPAELHHLYQRSDIFFLPLLDGAANNGMLEAMAHGLPVIATDLESTRYYTAGRATLCRPAMQEYRKAILQMLSTERHHRRDGCISHDLIRRANELVWPRVAQEMIHTIYR